MGSRADFEPLWSFGGVASSSLSANFLVRIGKILLIVSHLMKRFILFLILGIGVISLSSCWPLLVGAGATAGYMVRDKGYEVHAPVTKE